MTLAEIAQQLAKHRLEDVAAATGLSYWTVRRYRAGEVSEPPQEVVDRIVDYLRRHQ